MVRLGWDGKPMEKESLRQFSYLGGDKSKEGA